MFVLPFDADVDKTLKKHRAHKFPRKIINCTSSSRDQFRELSPFFLGPCKLPDGRVSHNMENAWQFSKVYPTHVGRFQNVDIEKWNAWSQAGFDTRKAIRYPMGKGSIPLFSMFRDERLSYVEARKRLYIALYAKAVVKTDAYHELKELRQQHDLILVIQDYDAYDNRELNRSLFDVLNAPDRKCGHGFVLAMLLLHGDKFWKDFQKPEALR